MLGTEIINLFTKRELFTEYTEPDENKNYHVSEKLVKSRMEKLYGDKDYALRDTHTKSHAAVKAELEIFDINDDEIKNRLVSKYYISPSTVQLIEIKTGLFKEAKKYNVWLRFANGDGRSNSDNKSDTRSMSVKIIDVEGLRLDTSHETKTQDIITQNGDVFLARTIKDYIGFLQAIFKSNLHLVLWLITHPTQWNALNRIKRHYPNSLLTETYWSGSAYALGDFLTTTTRCPNIESTRYPAVIKYAFLPAECNNTKTRIARQSVDSSMKFHNSYYRDDIIRRLAQPDAEYCWDFSIQFQTKSKLSIDDITLPWDEKDSPFFTIGRLKVKHQLVDYEKQQVFCENLRFSPWNGLKQHRPVGALNRLRKHVYPVVASFRLNKTGQKYTEPNGKESFD